MDTIVIERAKEAIRTRALSPEAALELAGELRKGGRFDLAWRVLTFDIDKRHPRYAEVKQQLAVATYKDEDFPSPQRLDDALTILKEAFDLDTTQDAETLSNVAAIYKRLWLDGGQRVNIERSYSFYRRAYELGANDNGYAGVNAAFMLDVIATQEREGVKPLRSVEADRRFEVATSIRNSVIERLLEQKTPVITKDQDHPWWYWASLAEAALGVARYDEAETWLKEGRKTGPHDWMLETTSRQMAAVARMQHDRDGGRDVNTRAYAVLQNALDLTADAVDSAFTGKVGLALSGGGFRASLFHIGVLAKLAELDVLRHVEVLSCVSGGSIIGAHYYLALKQKLEAKYDATNAPKGEPVMEQSDYIGIVQQIERDFLEGVQQNIRTRIGSSLLSAARVAFEPGYTRTNRAGALYEKLLYSKIDGVASRSIDQLLVTPKGTVNFRPKNDNWRRRAKVPILVLNATALNTGHNWQFTATWMGESPQAIGKAIDSIPRLRRMYYDPQRDNIPERWHHVPLGAAVGASAAVPGVFTPIVLDNLYPDYTVRLCDGGVHDNQGLASLLEQSCTVILVSDASGQMDSDQYPGGGLFPVMGRSNSVLQARVREAQYTDLRTRHRSGALSGMMFIHLTKDLEADPVSWIGATDADEKRSPGDGRTSYGVDVEIQKALAEVRTDLDSFSDAEAFALMTSGYRMAAQSFEKRCAPTIEQRPQNAYWRFLGADDALTKKNAAENARMKRLLETSKELAFKPWRQSPALAWLSGLLGIAAFAGIVWAFIANWSVPITTYGMLGILLFVGVLIVIQRKVNAKWIHIEKQIGDVVGGILLALACPFAWLHLAVFDPIFLWIGEWREATPPPAPLPAIATAGTPMLPIKAKTAPAAERRRPAVQRILRRVAPRWR